MRRLIIGWLLLILAVWLFIPQEVKSQVPARGFSFYNTTEYPTITPNATGIIQWRNVSGSSTNTATFSGLMGAGLDITGNPVRVVGSGKNTIFASSAASSDKTMTFPNVSGNVVSTGDSGTVTNGMLAGSITSGKLVGTDIATVGTVTSGTWQGTTIAVAYGGTGLTSSPTTRMTADATNATTTFSNLTDLSRSLVSGQKYAGELIVKCNNSTATEGIKLDFNGGSATASAFWAAGNQLVGGTDVLGTGISTSLGGVINFSTITGETLLVIKFSMVCSGTGTFIPRFAENSTAVGTATVELGSFMKTESTAN